MKARPLGAEELAKLQVQEKFLKDIKSATPLKT